MPLNELPVRISMPTSFEPVEPKILLELDVVAAAAAVIAVFVGFSTGAGFGELPCDDEPVDEEADEPLDGKADEELLVVALWCDAADDDVAASSILSYLRSHIGLAPSYAYKLVPGMGSKLFESNAEFK